MTPDIIQLEAEDSDGAISGFGGLRSITMATVALSPITASAMANPTAAELATHVGAKATRNEA